MYIVVNGIKNSDDDFSDVCSIFNKFSRITCFSVVDCSKMEVVRGSGCGFTMAIYTHDPPGILLVTLMLLHIVYFMEDDR